MYSTTNPGKFAEVAKLFSGYDITIHAPSEFGVTLDVDETGISLEENAILKAEAYRDAIKENVIVLGDDTGVEIKALGGEPGIKVRRWKGYKMADAEIIDYCIERLKGVSEDNRVAQFRTVIAVAKRGKTTKTFAGILDGTIVIYPTSQRIEGFPFASLFFSTKYKCMLGELHAMSVTEKLTRNMLTHRENAVTASLPYLLSLKG